MHPEIQKQHISYYQERLKWVSSEKDFASMAYPEQRKKIERWAAEEYEKCLKAVEAIRTMSNLVIAPIDTSTAPQPIVAPTTFNLNNSNKGRGAGRKFYGDLWIQELKRVLKTSPKGLSSREVFDELVESDSELLKVAVGQNLKSREEKIRIFPQVISNKLKTLAERGILNKTKGLMNEFLFTINENYVEK